MKWLKRSLWLLLALAVLAGSAAWIYRIRALPVTDGSLTVTGPKGEVRIDRDVHGIPTIRAGSIEDAAFGLGFAHAQDRLWQLETHRRIGAGRLAEAFGPPAVPTDRFLRALGVQRAAAAQWANVKGEERSGMEAYAAGINAYLREHLRARPPEFLLLGLEPEQWTPQDSMAWAVMMAWDLGGNWSTELLRLRLSLKLPLERVNEAIPPYPGEKPLATADYAALFRSLGLNGELGRQALLAAPPSGIEGLGSNNWVVAGSHTETGKPLLANDPHLKLTSPALWYFARLEAPGLKVAGATMPGLPIVVLGQNEHVAWGFTNTAPDVQDLYLERLKPDDPSQYQTPTGWAAFETWQEVIKVKGAADVPVTVRATRHGPVISDAGEVGEGVTGPKGKPAYALAMRWTALDADPGTVEAGLAFNRAASVDEFVAASARYTAPMQNMVVADKAGRIAFVAAGKVPQRSPANDLKGLVPAPGWDARYDWTGFLEPGRTPREIDPPRGWVATANQRIHPADYPHYITSDWAVPYRQQRIEQLLAARPKHTLESLAAIQRDELSLATVRLLPHLLATRAEHPLAAAAQKELAGFDGVMAADRAAPAIFYAWARHLTELVLADELGADLYQQQLGSRAFRDALELVLERNDAWWCDDKATPAAETCAQRSGEALRRALDELQAKLGGNVSAWRWGALHIARSEHRPFSKVKALAGWFELRSPVGGDTYTVNVSRVSLRPDGTTGEYYLDEHGPSLRALYDLGDPKQSRFMHSSGQSGLVFSPWYRSFVQPWTAVQYVPVWNDQAAAHSLVLTPR
ncbi:penicillin acylase family protein [Methylibium rhizosphaerae]|uniref:penicillin acylase family protein n=1 Tax=Methylibium rhizosphaerae TaxID=2570323 RepID=UPI00112EB10B|nr:penicillin acylase family protein [Methylibium rhizosphaerae]